MRIGILSDTHDNMPMTARALQQMARHGVELLLHAGDFVAPFAMKLLLKCDIPLIAVYGNNDGERAGLSKLCGSLHDGPHRFELEGRTILLAHEGEVMAQALQDGDDLAVCGHSHHPEIVVGPPLRVNPGEAGGWVTGRATGAVVDLKDMNAEIIEFGRQETVSV